MNGLAGHSESYLQLVWIVASVIGAAIVIALVIAYRHARAQRELEDAERVIAEAFPDDPS